MAASVSQVWPTTGHVALRRVRADAVNEVHMAINGGTPYDSRTCQTSDELLSWTADEHARWVTATPGRS